jgi:hypothetical protein
VKKPTRVYIIKILFICLLSVIPIGSLNAQNGCKDILEGSYWNLPGKGQLLVIGMLAESLSGQRLLAVSDYYWGSHENIYNYLRDHFLLKRVLWSGEMLIENPSAETGTGVIVLSINTSGFFWRQLRPQNASDVNSIQELKDSLDLYRPDLLTPFTQHMAYSDEHAHLDPLFRELHARNAFTPEDTVRHRFRNLLAIFFGLSNYFSMPHVSSEKQMSMLHRVSTDALRDIQLFLDSQNRFSRRRRSSQAKAAKTQKSSNPEGDFKILIEQIKNVAIRKSIDEEPEVLILNRQP